MLFQLCFRHESLVVFVAVGFILLVCLHICLPVTARLLRTTALLVEVHCLQQRAVCLINIDHAIFVSSERWGISTLGKSYRT